MQSGTMAADQAALLAEVAKGPDRIAYRRRLRSEIGERKARVADYLPAILRPLGSGSVRASTPKPTPATSPEVTRSKPRLRTYYEGE